MQKHKNFLQLPVGANYLRQPGLFPALITVVNILTPFLLVVNGLSALAGGWLLMTSPDGSSLQLPLSYLQHSSFQNYFVPGLILFTANGICSMIALAFVTFKWPLYPHAVFYQGVILTGWIVIQVILMQEVYFLHLILGGMGILLMVFGVLLYFNKENK